MEAKSLPFQISGWLFGLVVFAIGAANLLLVHPVPGITFLLLSLVYFPPANVLLRDLTGISIPLLVKIILGVVIVMFTLGVSDLGDMLDDVLR